MACNSSKQKMGYLPISEHHHAAITSLVAPATPAHRMLDPYGSEGEFLDVVAQEWNVTPYTNEGGRCPRQAVHRPFRTQAGGSL